MSEAVIPIGSLILAFIFLTILMHQNYKQIIKDKPKNIEMRRKYKKEKNKKLAKALGIKLKDD